MANAIEQAAIKQLGPHLTQVMAAREERRRYKRESGEERRKAEKHFYDIEGTKARTAYSKELTAGAKQTREFALEDRPRDIKEQQLTLKKLSHEVDGAAQDVINTQALIKLNESKARVAEATEGTVIDTAKLARDKERQLLANARQSNAHNAVVNSLTLDKGRREVMTSLLSAVQLGGPNAGAGFEQALQGMRNAGINPEDYGIGNEFNEETKRAIQYAVQAGVSTAAHLRELDLKEQVEDNHLDRELARLGLLHQTTWFRELQETDPERAYVIKNEIKEMMRKEDKQELRTWINLMGDDDWNGRFRAMAVEELEKTVGEEVELAIAQGLAEGANPERQATAAQLNNMLGEIVSSFKTKAMTRRDVDMFVNREQFIAHARKEAEAIKKVLRYQGRFNPFVSNAYKLEATQEAQKEAAKATVDPADKAITDNIIFNPTPAP